MPVPFIDLKRFESGFLEEWNQTIAELSRNASFIGGTPVSALEENLAKENGVTYAAAVANGTDALQVALRSAGVGARDIVLLPDATFWATFEAVVNVNAYPVTVDVNRDDLQMDYDLFVQAVEKYKPKAAILVHLYGWGSASLSKFRSYCRRENIHLIEDGAQCYGVQYKGESIYKDAFASTISFYPAKVLGAAGDGGAVLTSEPNIAWAMRSLANHGRESHYAHGLVGWNSRLDTFQAAYLNLAMKHLPEKLKSRREAALFYQKTLPTLGINCITPPSDFVENGYLNVCLFDPKQRTQVEDALKRNGIGCGITYPMPVSEQKGAQHFLKGKVGGENAKRLSESVLNLPLFPYIRQDELNEVVSVLKGAL